VPSPPDTAIGLLPLVLLGDTSRLEHRACNDPISAAAAVPQGHRVLLRDPLAAIRTCRLVAPNSSEDSLHGDISRARRPIKDEPLTHRGDQQ
jgi:hypothetical protein